MIDCDLDLDISPVERVARMMAKGISTAAISCRMTRMATQKSGRTFLNELKDAGSPNCRAVPRTHDIWVGINRLRQMLPRFQFRIPQCERGLEALEQLSYDPRILDWDRERRALSRLEFEPCVRRA